METEADICNLALSYAEQQQFIDSLDDATVEAQCCKVAYAPARDSLLRRFPWPWATKHSVLALLSGVTRSGWTYAYALPVDLLAPQYVFAGARPGALAASSIAAVQQFWSGVSGTAVLPAINGAIPVVPYALEVSDDKTRQILVTDQENAELVYTCRPAVPALPPDFVEALAYEIASRIARSLVKDRALAQSLRQEAEAHFGIASSAALNSQQPDAIPDSSFIAVRG